MLSLQFNSYKLLVCFKLHSMTSGADPELDVGGVLYGMLWDPLGGTGECNWGEGCLNLPSEPAVSKN